MNKKANGTTIVSLILVIAISIFFIFYFTNQKDNQNKEIFNLTKYETATFYNTTYILPNPNLSPGDILTNNLTIICVSGYSTTVRDVPQSLREEVFSEYHVNYPQPTGSTELDHIIPLCLGGSNDIKNLFVQFNQSGTGYHEKDKLENYLCDHVCNGEIDINYAQQRIAKDWYSYYLEIYSR